jgi:hypothetical protein
LHYRSYLIQFDKENVLVNSIGGDGETNIVNVQRSCILNVQSGVSKPIFENFQGEIIYDFDQYDQFNPEDFIALNRPSFATKDYELGRFQKRTGKYTPLIKNPDVSILYDSITDNLVIYTLAKDEKKSYDVSTELYFMNRDGTNQRSISLGTNATIYEYRRLDKNRGCFRGYNAGPKLLDVIFLVNQPNQTITKLMEVGKAYKFIGIWDNQMMVKVSDLEDNSSIIYLYDFDGTRLKELFSITNSVDYTVYREILDTEGKRFFYSYRSPDNIGHIMVYDFSTSQLEEIYSHELDDYEKRYFPILMETLNKEKNFLSFKLDINKKQTWCILYLDTGKVDEIPLPKNTNFRLSSDGKYLMCMNINGNYKKSGIMDYETKKLKVFTTNLEVDFLSPSYIEATQEFYFNLRGNHDGSKIYSVKPTGELKEFKLE